MQLMIQTGFNDSSSESLLNPSLADIEAKILSLDWSKFTNVQLNRNDDNWLSGSGALAEDWGLAIMLSLDGIQHVADAAPAEPIDLIPYFAAYLKCDNLSVLRLIYLADEKGLSKEDLQSICEKERIRQTKS